ncbi:MAG TPA: hypothetical protein VMV92_42790 [Streptosporangiaceae bacterium]|nr:hypothetical protein [Streptosporangiaceae bacterium]
MAGSDTLDVDFDDIPAEPVGYLERPGFAHGGVGVAACWYGGPLCRDEAHSRRVADLSVWPN